MTALSFSRIRKTFGTTVALDDFDLEVAEGEFVSLLGPSGCGKTTALRIAAGFERPDGGSVVVGGTDITRLPAHRRNMGMVFQSYSLFPNLTVAGNVAYGLRTRDVAKAERTRRVGEMLELVALGELANRYPHQLSGGQQQRVALARALAPRPSVLLLDEPLSALDAKVRASLREELRRVQSEVGITTLFVTHDQEEALGISDRVGVMSNGRLEQLASPVDVYRNPASAFVARFVGSMNEIPAAASGTGTVSVADRIVDVPLSRKAVIRGPILLLVRPEDVQLVSAGLGLLDGTVTGSTFHGATTALTVRLDIVDRLLTCTAPSALATAIAPGSRVGVEFDLARAVCEPVGSSGAN